MTTQQLSDLQRDATDWWIKLLLEERVNFGKKYIGTGNPKTLSHLEIMYCYLYYTEETIG